MQGTPLSIKLDPKIKLTAAHAARLIQAHLETSLVASTSHLSEAQLEQLYVGDDPVADMLIYRAMNPGLLIYCGPPENKLQLPDTWSNLEQLIKAAQRIGADYLRLDPEAADLPGEILEAIRAA